MWLHVLGTVRVSHGAFRGEPFGAVRFCSKRCWWQDQALRMEGDDGPRDVVADGLSTVETAPGFAAPHAWAPLRGRVSAAFAKQFRGGPLA